MFLPGFSTLGSTGPIEKLRRGHEGEKRVTVSYSILVHHSRWQSFRMYHLHMSMRRSRYFMDAANWVFSKDAITN